ncbi:MULTISPECIES: sensor histidine kinase [Myroides]|uniref:sensor histidine kinase n=1 Tax=Myroides TaxID=76831 RepID=UPI000280A723|nr:MULTISPECIES: sensor histidine kinase [Myroides]APA91043.1 histidine kinase [Myroides sp. ZB35]EKB02198.1 hypothetical protein HMPREF9711_03404 [Myroides odoratimimus CCUG 3837]
MDDSNNIEASTIKDGFYKIRPAARIVHTIGGDLIGDSYSALIELVKNSYDADAENVKIIFDYSEGINNLKITVSDDGHGMSFDTIVNKWLVPATNDKLERKYSIYKKRPLQGRKGIGRFAASILGQEMTMTSVSKDKEKSTIVIDWRLFNSNDYLENIDLLVESRFTDEMSGTTLIMSAVNDIDDLKVSVWDQTTIKLLLQELSKLLSPFEKFTDDKFEIVVDFISSPFQDFTQEMKILSSSIIDFYDYRISGVVDNIGRMKLEFIDNTNPDAQQVEKIEKQIVLQENGKYCGNITFDYRVFDREPDAIENLISKGLIDRNTGRGIGKQEARRLLNEIYGVNIYKNSFRIRPYGNKGVDWLDLDKDRIQNMTQKLSNNQVVGFVIIESEELSGLEEKSARDGLKENKNYQGLKEISKKVLAELEIRRFSIRTKSKKSRNTNVNDKIKDLFSLNDVKTTIGAKLKELNVSKETIDEINTILDNEEQSKEKLRQEVENIVAIYQGQATLGKIVTFIIHEGRKPLQFFNSEYKNIDTLINYFKKTKDDSVLDRLVVSVNNFKVNSKRISNLFNRVSPLARYKRGVNQNFKVISIIEDAISIFHNSLDESKIKVNISCDASLELFGQSEDLFIALTNLLENSLYWLGVSTQSEKFIIIDVFEKEGSIVIDYKDNGPGLTKDEVKSNIIFEPGYTKKLNGTGLGLAISGEAVDRLNGKLIAINNDLGVYFRIEIKVKNE